MSIAMAGIGVGGTIFSPIITTLLEYYGWRHTYQIMALIILVLAFPAASSFCGNHLRIWDFFHTGARNPPSQRPLPRNLPFLSPSA